MSERTLEAINKEYAETAAAFGDRKYKLELLTQEAEQLKAKMLKLNQEAAALIPKEEVLPPAAA